jgi:hypothetical protein
VCVTEGEDTVFSVFIIGAVCRNCSHEGWKW